MATVSLELPDDLASRLAAAARRLGVSRSRLVRDAIEQHLARRRRRESAADRAGDLIGSLAGPGDLSTNDRHFRGFGD
jgi:predicted transcriptional regulator